MWPCFGEMDDIIFGNHQYRRKRKRELWSSGNEEQDLDGRESRSQPRGLGHVGTVNELRACCSSTPGHEQRKDHKWKEVPQSGVGLGDGEVW